MSSHRTENELRAIWQNQSVSPVQLTPDQLRAGSAKFRARIRLRNALEYSAAVVVVLGFGYSVLHAPQILMRVSSALTILAALFVVYYLYRHGSARPLPADSGMQSCLAFSRQELERQRNLTQSVWRWYLAPFIPGVTLNCVAILTGEGPVKWVAAPIVIAVLVAVFIGIGRLNQAAARRLQRAIDDLDALIGKGDVSK